MVVTVSITRVIAFGIFSGIMSDAVRRRRRNRPCESIFIAVPSMRWMCLNFDCRLAHTKSAGGRLLRLSLPRDPGKPGGLGIEWE